MSDKPILFSGPMVRALLAGTKTQTRRVLKNSALAAHEPQWEARKGEDGIWRLEADSPAVSGLIVPDIRIAVGDRLYVRETIRAEWPEDVHSVRYAADQELGSTSDQRWDNLAKGRAIPGIHMPRWASRITLTVTDVRVERLQDISEADALAEGIVQHGRFFGLEGAEWDEADLSAVAAYRRLWEHINGAGSWEANPWVAAYTFTGAMANIDSIGVA